MDKNANELKKEIEKIKKLLDLSDCCEGDKNRKMLLDEFENLSYRYFKSAVTRMRDVRGDGDGI